MSTTCNYITSKIGRALAGAMVIGSVSAAPAFAADKLTVFSQPIANYDSVWMADAKGLFAAEGLEITFKQFPSGTTALQSFKAGEGDILFGGDFPGLQYWLNNNHDYRLIAAIERDVDGYLLTADKSINKPSDLKGKTVATRVGSTVDWFMSQYLYKNGLTKDDVKIKNLDGQVMPAALCQGDIDAFFFWQPYNDKAIEVCPNKAHNVTNAEGYIPGYVIAAARPEWLKDPKNAKLATAFLRAVIKGKAIAEKDLAAVAAYGDAKFSMPKDALEKQWKANKRLVTLDKTVYADYCGLADWMRREKMLDGKIDLKDFVWTDGLKAIDPALVSTPPGPC